MVYFPFNNNSLNLFYKYIKDTNDSLNSLNKYRKYILVAYTAYSAIFAGMLYIQWKRKLDSKQEIKNLYQKLTRHNQLDVIDWHSLAKYYRLIHFTIQNDEFDTIIQLMKHTLDNGSEQDIIDMLQALSDTHFFDINKCTHLTNKTIYFLKDWAHTARNYNIIIKDENEQDMLLDLSSFLNNAAVLGTDLEGVKQYNSQLLFYNISQMFILQRWSNKCSLPQDILNIIFYYHLKNYQPYYYPQYFPCISMELKTQKEVLPILSCLYSQDFVTNVIAKDNYNLYQEMQTSLYKLIAPSTISLSYYSIQYTSQKEIIYRYPNFIINANIHKIYIDHNMLCIDYNMVCLYYKKHFDYIVSQYNNHQCSKLALYSCKNMIQTTITTLFNIHIYLFIRTPALDNWNSIAAEIETELQKIELQENGQAAQQNQIV